MPLSEICTPGWGITTLLWSGQPAPSPFLHFSAVEKLLFKGIARFRPQVDLSTDCVSFHPSLAFPQWMSLSLKASKTDAFHQGHLLVIACSTSPVCAVTAMREYFLTFCQYRPLSSFQLGIYLLDPLLLTFSATPYVKSVYHTSLSKGTVFVLVLPLSSCCGVARLVT